jgi:hypothetical protein
MSPQRFDAGPAVAALGALLLFISLFLAWYAGGQTGWDVFESLDLILAALAVGALLAAAAAYGALPGPSVRWLPALGAVGVIVVLVQLVGPPPAARGADREVGAWLALAGSGIVLLGGILAVARLSLTLVVDGRGDAPRRVRAVDRRRGGAGPGIRAARTAGGTVRRPVDDGGSRRAASPLEDPERTASFRLDDETERGGTP